MKQQEQIKAAFDQTLQTIEDMLSAQGDGYYVVATRSNSFISKAIRWFSRIGSGLDEYDHVTLVHKGTEIHMTTPHIEMRPFEYRNQNEVWKIRFMPERAWSNALRIYDRHLDDNKYGRYGKAQLVSKALTMLLGISPIKARRDCIEFVLECLIEPKPPKADYVTVAEGIKALILKGYISYVGSVNK